MPKFSIILPVKNGGNYFKLCIQSLLQQTYADYNILVLDNNSADSTISWLKDQAHPHIHIFTSNDDLDICGNWGRIVGVEKGEFITLIGHDDILLPHYLETMNRLIEKHPNASLYQAHFDYIDAKGAVVRPCKPMSEKMEDYLFLKGQFTQTIDSMGTGYMMRSADYDQLGGIPMHYPNLIFADYELWVRLSGINYLAVTPDTCFQYRLHDSVSKITNGEDYQKAYFLYLDFLQTWMKDREEVKKVFETYGKGYMLYFCKSLAHRILKTPIANRKISVAQFVEKCNGHAAAMLPDQSFSTTSQRSIQLAIWFDQNAFTRSAFKIIKQMTLLFNR